MAKFDPFLSLDCARVEGVGAQSKERKGSNFAAQRSGAIVQKPEGPNTHDSKNPAIAIWQPWIRVLQKADFTEISCISVSDSVGQPINLLLTHYIRRISESRPKSVFVGETFWLTCDADEAFETCRWEGKKN